MNVTSSTADDSVTNNDGLSTGQVAALVYSPCVTSPFSVVGSGCIVYMLLSAAPQDRLKRPSQRILLGLSLMDLFYSSVSMFNPLLIPEDSNIFGALGNQATCNLQGFVSQVSIGTAFYNAMLSIYFACVICFQMTDVAFQRYIERWLHVIPVLFVFVTGVWGIGQGLFNFEVAWCYIAAYPSGCDPISPSPRFIKCRQLEKR